MTLMITSSGNFFGELMPTFGGGSISWDLQQGSKGCPYPHAGKGAVRTQYRVSIRTRVVLELAILKSGVPRSKITQVLDNVVACRALVEAAYRDICETIGVSLVGLLRHYVLKVSPLAKTQMTW